MFVFHNKEIIVQFFSPSTASCCVLCPCYSIPHQFFNEKFLLENGCGGSENQQPVDNSWGEFARLKMSWCGMIRGIHLLTHSRPISYPLICHDSFVFWIEVSYRGCEWVRLRRLAAWQPAIRGKMKKIMKNISFHPQTYHMLDKILIKINFINMYIPCIRWYPPSYQWCDWLLTGIAIAFSAFTTPHVSSAIIPLTLIACLPFHPIPIPPISYIRIWNICMAYTTHGVQAIPLPDPIPIPVVYLTGWCCVCCLLVLCSVHFIASYSLLLALALPPYPYFYSMLLHFPYMSGRYLSTQHSYYVYICSQSPLLNVYVWMNNVNFPLLIYTLHFKHTFIHSYNIL